MWLLPSRGRPHLAQRLFDQGNFKTPGLLILDTDDADKYDEVRLPNDWEKLVIPRMFLSPKLNAGFAHKPNEPWYGILNDDHLPKTWEWDLLLQKAVQNQPLVWPKDNYADRISTPVFDGDMIRRIGWICPPELNHFYIDDAHELIAEVLGCTRVEHVTVSHEHVNKGRMKPDQTYRERPEPNRDRTAFQKWCSQQWPEIRKRLEC